MKTMLILIVLLFGEVCIIGLLAFNKPLKLPDSMTDQIKQIYYQETPKADTNLISNICEIYQEYGQIVSCPKSLFIAHCYVMKLESDITDDRRINASGDIGISQINTNTWKLCKNQFISDMLEKSKQRDNYKLVLSLINQSGNIGNLKLNICFSLWYLKLLSDESKNTKEIISKYNCGRTGAFDTLPKITQKYIVDYEKLDKKYSVLITKHV